MSKHRLPPPKFLGQPIYGPDVKEFTIGSWCPTPDGSGQPTAVAIVIELASGQSLVLRMRTPERVDETIQALLRHKREVWPEAS